jgi:hypothetical protein
MLNGYENIDIDIKSLKTGNEVIDQAIDDTRICLKKLLKILKQKN